MAFVLGFEDAAFAFVGPSRAVADFSLGNAVIKVVNNCDPQSFRDIVHELSRVLEIVGGHGEKVFGGQISVLTLP
jgi:hypothetical protein